MAVTKKWRQLRLDNKTSLVPLLDASECAREQQAEISKLTSQLLDSVAYPERKNLFFLGNPHAYPAREFSRRAQEWFSANRGRLPILGPILEAIGDQSVTLVVLAAERIVDLEDWHDFLSSKNVLFVPFGTDRLTGGRYVEFPAVIDQLRVCLSNPIVKVEILFEAGMPFFWDNPAYRWDKDRLVADKGDTFSVEIGFFGDSDGEPQAFATRADRTNADLQLLLHQDCLSYTWHPLPAAEESIVRQCLAGKRFQCPGCKTERGPEHVKCYGREDGVVGTPVFSSVRNLLSQERSSFVLLREEQGQIRVAVHSCAALDLKQHTVAILRGGTADLYCWNGKVWGEAGRLAPYSPVGDGTYAVVL